MPHPPPRPAPAGPWTPALPVESVALLAAFLLTVVDALATHAWLSAGIALEANPLLRSLMERVGIEVALGLRVAVGGALLLLLRALAERSRLARAALLAAVAVLAGVVVWHLQGLLLLATI